MGATALKGWSSKRGFIILVRLRYHGFCFSKMHVSNLPIIVCLHHVTDLQFGVIQWLQQKWPISWCSLCPWMLNMVVKRTSHMSCKPSSAVFCFATYYKKTEYIWSTQDKQQECIGIELRSLASALTARHPPALTMLYTASTLHTILQAGAGN